MSNWQDKIRYLCKRYDINAAFASETLSQLDQDNQLDIEELALECDWQEAAHKED